MYYSVLIWIFISTAIGIALKFGIDKKVVVFGTLVVGVFTQAFAGLAALIGAVPLIGPFVVKLFAILIGVNSSCLIHVCYITQVLIFQFVG